MFSSPIMLSCKNQSEKPVPWTYCMFCTKSAHIKSLLIDLWHVKLTQFEFNLNSKRVSKFSVLLLIFNSLSGSKIHKISIFDMVHLSLIYPLQIMWEMNLVSGTLPTDSQNLVGGALDAQDDGEICATLFTQVFHITESLSHEQHISIIFATCLLLLFKWFWGGSPDARSQFKIAKSFSSNVVYAELGV